MTIIFEYSYCSIEKQMQRQKGDW